MFNLTVYEVASKQGHAFLWNETNGQRGSNEIATCISRLISSLPKETKQLLLYSDSCPVENNNAIIACMLQYALAMHNSLAIIQINFLEPGHTHGMTQSARRQRKRTVVRMAKKRGLPYKVNRLTMAKVHKATDS